jgi:hypothetical protein
MSTSRETSLFLRCIRADVRHSRWVQVFTYRLRFSRVGPEHHGLDCRARFLRYSSETPPYLINPSSSTRFWGGLFSGLCTVMRDSSQSLPII